MNQPITDAYKKIFADKQRILVVFAHPDDLELYCGGLVARLTSDNKVVRSVKITSGDMGSQQEVVSSEELKVLRESEDRKSMQVLGITEDNNVYLGLRDGGVEHNLDNIGLLAQQIRIFKPDLIITHNPEDKIIRFDKDINWVNHRDHLNTALNALDAAFPYSRDLLFFPEHFDDKDASSHSVSEFLLVDFYEHPDLVHIDVTSSVDQRVKAHACHASQYSAQDAQESADFFTLLPHFPKGKRFERFRYVIAD
ncbi:PIG-L family deacetylase [Patescibacteria group bacterium]|nr:PIG-L family deacetylase [Patescibacteria group bacterium]